MAENSTLSDILHAVRAQTGADVEVPPNATERVVAHLGPGPARDILAALLNGTHFNYVMLGSPAHPDSVERLILTSKSGGVPDVAPPAPAAQNTNQFQVDDQGVQGVDISEQPVDDPGENSASAETPQPQPNAQQVKTPEQLLRELQNATTTAATTTSSAGWAAAAGRAELRSDSGVRPRTSDLFDFGPRTSGSALKISDFE